MKVYLLAGLRSEKRELAGRLGWYPGPMGCFQSSDMAHRLNHAGPGPDGVAMKMRTISNQLRDYDWLVSVGTCGALTSEMVPGETMCRAGRMALEKDSEPRVIDQDTSLLITVENPVVSIEDRDRVLERWPEASYVDMESAFVHAWMDEHLGSAAPQMKVLRVVSDRADLFTAQDYLRNQGPALDALATELRLLVAELGRA